MIYPAGMISALQMIYVSRMKERILYHACEASISHRASDISLKYFMGYVIIDLEKANLFDDLKSTLEILK